MRAAIYIRVSTDEQATEGFSIRAQKNQLVEYCRVNDYELANIYIDEGYSAKDTNRPRLQELLQAAREGAFDAVVVYKLDRFTRSVKDLYDLLEFLQKNSVGFISKQEKFDTTSAMGRAMIGILGVFAQFERELIAERVRFGLEQKVREGKRPGGKFPYGYDGKGNDIEEEFFQLRLVRTHYMSGKSYQGVAFLMLRDRHKRRDKDWTATTVALSLENPFYAGIIRFGSKLPNGKYPYRKRELKVKVIDVVGTHKPVWTIEEYEEHLARMRRRSDGGHSKKAEYWFNGVLRCGKCGSSMFGRLSTKRSLKDGTILRAPYYWCSRRKENKGCDMPMFRQKHVEYLVMNHIDSLRMDPDEVAATQEELQKSEADKKSHISRLRRDLEKVKVRIKKWQYAFAEDMINEFDFKKRMEEEYEVESAILETLGHVEENEVVATDVLFELMGLWDVLDDLDKQAAVGKVFERITLNTEQSNVKGVKNAFFPASVDIKYRQ